MLLNTFPKFDLTITISVILAVCAIISPILTSIINNHYQIKIRKLELEHETYKNTLLHEQQLFENYLKCAGRYLCHSDTNTATDYAESYYSTLYLVPKNIRDQMISINKEIDAANILEATKKLESLAPSFHTINKTNRCC